jgi:hypothetical protein
VFFFRPSVFEKPTDDTIRVGFAKKLKICRQCLNLSIVVDDFSHHSHYILACIMEVACSLNKREAANGTEE